MDIDYSLNAVRIRKTGYFYQGERKVLYSDYKKPSDTARRNKQLRNLLKDNSVWANGIAKEKYNSYLTIIEKKIEAGEFPSDAPKDELMEEALIGIRYMKVTPQILVLIRTGKITRKTIRNDMVKYVLDGLERKFLQEDSTDKQQSKSKSASASGIGDKET